MTLHLCYMHQQSVDCWMSGACTDGRGEFVRTYTRQSSDASLHIKDLWTRTIWDILTSISDNDKDHKERSISNFEVDVVVLKIGSYGTPEIQAWQTLARDIFQSQELRSTTGPEIGRAVQQECRDRSRMPSSA
eukprot:TRINITY_DN5907_c0_g1_i5.p1 TRINITY_DN5907_c0_g1~~TRINITY_DN5907_c0_g1_i5.p1  ORF type:complete len:133 (-),score=8.23 TRINITY_DN5907_c0_g1_i5:10-408(-)